MKLISSFLSKFSSRIETQYAALLMVFIRVIWPMWHARDLTFGDTSSYYLTAVRFANSLECNIAWSPLYTSFFGSFLWIQSDPYFAVIAQRIVILAVATILVFEIGRRILIPPLAWLTTVWWLALPITHDTLYEVHLFSVLPVLLIWCLLITSSSMRIRGACAGLFVGSTLLIRNELLIAGAIFISLSLLHDFRAEIAIGPLQQTLRRIFLSYGLPIALAFAVIGVFYCRSYVKYPELTGVLRIKHTLNVSQIYAFGYGQRHPEYTDNPWVSYQKLMIDTFGQELPTMREALVANPKAMLEHFGWNAVLIPSGVQLAMFNVRGGEHNPDYAPSNRNAALAWTLSVLCLLGIASATILVFRNRAEFRQLSIFAHGWFVAALVAACFTTLIVMIMQRPRPSYMFPLSVSLIWLVGLSVQVIFARIRLLPFLGSSFAAVMAMALWVIPAYGQQHPPGNRPLLERYQMIQPHRDAMLRVNARVASPGYNYELSSYLGLPVESVVNLDAIISETPVEASLAESLRRQQIRVVLFADYELADDRVRRFIASCETEGWLADQRNAGTGKYLLYTKLN